MPKLFVTHLPCFMVLDDKSAKNQKGARRQRIRDSIALFLLRIFASSAIGMVATGCMNSKRLAAHRACPYNIVWGTPQTKLHLVTLILQGGVDAASIAASFSARF
ncbi:hypothetical protein XPA_006774 [Xanthoria parietina]